MKNWFQIVIIILLIVVGLLVLQMLRYEHLQGIYVFDRLRGKVIKAEIQERPHPTTSKQLWKEYLRDYDSEK